MIVVAFYDTKPYDRQYFEAAANSRGCDAAFTSSGSRQRLPPLRKAQTRCVFLQTTAWTAPALRRCTRAGVNLVVLRCAGFNNVDQAVTYVGLDTLLVRSEIISLHVPLTAQTHFLVNSQTLARMKPGVFLVNTSRGKLIDTAALIETLQQGRLGGVALDVYEEEEGIFFEDHSGEVLQDDELSRLLMFPNVLITSHQGFLTQEALREIARVTIGNLAKLAQSQPLSVGTILVDLAAALGPSTQHQPSTTP